MAYTLPPQMGIGTHLPQHAQYEDDKSAPNDQGAQLAAVRSDPGSRVVDSTKSQYGWTNKVHMVDRDGRYTTVMLDEDHNVTEMRDGYC